MWLTEQQRRQQWFRDHWAQGVPFNRHCGIEVRRGWARMTDVTAEYDEFGLFERNASEAGPARQT